MRHIYMASTISVLNIHQANILTKIEKNPSLSKYILESAIPTMNHESAERKVRHLSNSAVISCGIGASKSIS